MIPISAIVGVSTIGYLLDQVFRENEFDENNKYNEIPVENINGCAEQYPWNYIESFESTQMSNGSNDGNGSYGGNGSNGIKEINKLNNNNKDLFMNNTEPSPLNPEKIGGPNNIMAINEAGNPPTEYFINATERPVQDFAINNMVPFFSGSGTNQDMRSTGVAQANIISEDFNLGNNNKTPYNTTLSTFVGCDDTYMHKREAPNFFSPLERRDRYTIPGEAAEAQRPLRDRYTTSILTKNDQTPFEKQMVGPGIAVDANLPNGGEGFNSGISTQIRPNNVNAYRLTQLPGRVAGTKYQSSNLPTALLGTGPSFESFKNSKTNNNAWENNKNGDGMIDTEKLINEGSMYGVPLKKEPLIYKLEDRPLTASLGVTQAPSYYSNYILPSATDKRTVTNVSFGQSVKVE